MVPGHPNHKCSDCGGPVEDLDFGYDGKFHCIGCRRKKLGREPRERPIEECRDLFIKKVWAYISYWEKESRAPSVREKLEGLAHSLLVILDGGAIDLPGFIVAPVCHPEDAKFLESRGEDWWPHNGQEIQDKIKADIAGGLHGEFHKKSPAVSVNR